jgi:hypothetical protein
MAQEFNPNQGGKVPKADAEKWIEKYDREHRKDKGKDIKSVFYGKEFINKIFAENPQAAGISVIFGKKLNEYSGKDDMALVLVPTTEDGKLLWPTMTNGKDGSEAAAYDKAITCPPYCPQ